MKNYKFITILFRKDVSSQDVYLFTCMLLDKILVWLPSSISHVSSCCIKTIHTYYSGIIAWDNDTSVEKFQRTWTSFSICSIRVFSSNSTYTVKWGSKHDEIIPRKLNCHGNIQDNSWLLVNFLESTYIYLNKFIVGERVWYCTIEQGILLNETRFLIAVE